MATTLRDERARARMLLREAALAPAAAPAAAPPLPPVRAPPANPRVMVDLTGWHAVPASQAAQFYTERGALVCEQPGFASQPR